MTLRACSVNREYIMAKAPVSLGSVLRTTAQNFLASITRPSQRLPRRRWISGSIE